MHNAKPEHNTTGDDAATHAVHALHKRDVRAHKSRRQDSQEPARQPPPPPPQQQQRSKKPALDVGKPIVHGADRKLQDEPFSFDDIFDPALRPRGFSATWMS